MESNQEVSEITTSIAFIGIEIQDTDSIVCYWYRFSDETVLL